jgi:protein disulfide-isomerase A1
VSTTYRPGNLLFPATSSLFGPGGTRHLLGYEGFANGSDTTFTMFSMPWCGHCKKATPLFKSLGPTVTIDGKTVALRHVDLEQEPNAAAGYEIEGYPTFYLDHAGVRSKFDGPRTPDGFLEFLTQKLSA